jgi:RNA polymerase sigma-70 factor (ECF subfamily)
MSVTASSFAASALPPPFKLVPVARSASEQRLCALMRRHGAAVSRRLRRLGVPHGSVDDAAQRVFWVVSRKLDRIETGGELSFLLSTAARVASDVRRVEARRSRREVALECDSESGTRVDEMLDLKRTRTLLDAVLSAMPAELSQVLMLSEGEGLTAPEISQLSGVPVGTVASRLRRARCLMQRRTLQLRLPLRQRDLSVG